MNANYYTVDLRKPAPVREAVLEFEAVETVRRSPFVFTLAAYVLLFVMLFSPFARVFADEVDVQESAPEVALESEVITPAVSEEEPLVEETVLEEVTNEDVEPIENTETVSEVTEEVAEETPPVEEGDVENSGAVIENEGEVLGEATSTPETITEETVEEVVEETPAESEPEIVYIEKPFTPDSSQVLFNAADCVTVSDGEFYCVKSQQNADSALQKSAPTPMRSVISQKDGDGDLEIYLSEEGVTKQITFNTTDDDAPSYDADTGMIAWHAIANHRYQIFIYNPKTNSIVQLTDTSFNNTNPSIDGDVVSWQAWEDDNWEIFYASLAAGISSESLPEAVRVSRNTEADMFPKTYNRFITWQARVSDSWRTRGFNVTTGEYADLGEGTGGDIASARLVLLVERRGENGALERVGYEVETGEAIPLGVDTPAVPGSAIPESPIDGTAGSIPETNTGNTLKTASRSGDGDADTDTDTDSETEDTSS